MSLDLDIISSKPIKHKGTGVYVRKNGETVELKSIDEIIAYFPDADLSNIGEEEYEDYIAWHGNITHNLGHMASKIPVNDHSLYNYLWHPSEIGYINVNQEYIEAIKMGYDYLKGHKEELEKYNSPNGWGTYENLLNFVGSLYECLSNLDIEFSDDYTILADV